MPFQMPPPENLNEKLKEAAKRERSRTRKKNTDHYSVKTAEKASVKNFRLSVDGVTTAGEHTSPLRPPIRPERALMGGLRMA